MKKIKQTIEAAKEKTLQFADEDEELISDDDEPDDCIDMLPQLGQLIETNMFDQYHAYIFDNIFGLTNKKMMKKIVFLL